MKYDKSRKTGSGGDCCLTEFDRLVLDVEGVETPGVAGLQEVETWENTTEGEGCNKNDNEEGNINESQNIDLGDSSLTNK